MERKSPVSRYGLVLVLLALVASLVLFMVQRSGPGSDAPVATEEAEATASSAPDPRREPIDAAQTASVEIRVLSSSGAAPIGAATLELAFRPTEPDGPAPLRRSATTDADGKVVLEGLPAGEWRVVARARGYFGAAREFAIRAVGGVAPHRWDLELDAVARIEGIVRAPGGEPCAGTIARVIVPDRSNRSRAFLHPDDQEEARRHDWTADGEGRFSIGVAPIRTRATLVLDHPDRGRAVVEIPALEPGAVHQVDQELTAHTEIVGRVLRGSDEATTVTVECWHTSEDGKGLIAEHQTRVGPDGSFRLRRLSGGRKRLVSMARSGTSIEVGTLEAVAPAGETTDVGTIPSGTSRVLVTVVTDEPSQPDREATVTVNAVLAADDTVHVPLSIPMDLGGEFELVGLPACTLVIHACVLDGAGPHLDPAYDEANARAECDGIRPLRVDLVIPRVVRAASGTVVAEIRSPPGITDEAVDAHAVLLRNGEVVVAFSRPWIGGREYRFPRVPPGEYQVAAVANGYRSAILPAVVRADAETRLVVDTWSRTEPVRGRVVDADGRAVPGAGVAVTAPSSDDTLGRVPVLEVVADDTGRFVFAALPEFGDLRAVAWTQGATTPTVGLRWDAPEQDLELRLTDGGR